jgi:hypothetical protein
LDGGGQKRVAEVFYGAINRLLVEASLDGGLARFGNLGSPGGFLEVVQSLYQKEAVGLVEALDLLKYGVDLLTHGDSARARVDVRQGVSIAGPY